MRLKKTMVAPLAIGLGLAGWFVTLLWLEKRRPLRPSVEDKTIRLARNGAIAGLTAATLQILEQPLVMPLCRLVEQKRLGFLPNLIHNRLIYSVLSVCALDYTLYIWHVLAHKVPFLWRFHVVHHIDLDLDASTAVRFHFGEMTISILWRLLQVRLLGVTPNALMIWQSLLMASILFQHSNLRLPERLERKLNLWVVTPNIHAIHHSIFEQETNSNWSSGLTIWDKLHGTYRRDVPQDAITIGVPAYRSTAEVNLTHMLRLPFVRQLATWLLPDGTQLPTRLVQQNEK